MGLTRDPTGTSSEDFQTLYRLAFERFGVPALWSNRAADDPGRLDTLAITRQLRAHGGMEGRRLAERIEGLCSATD